MRIFRRIALAAVLMFLLPHAARASDSWATWQTSTVQTLNGTPQFLVDGKPFFVYGAAFFYERTPRSQWRDDLLAYKRAGINTIDLYLIWNWHEPDSNTVDFTGATNPRRDLHALFSLIHELGFKVVVRPGPVIRNEWKNGGYPDWLLQRPGYNMPLHDILEGRYPATATYQNAHADSAAAEWMHNAVHLAQSKAWLRSVLREIEPWSHDVIAIALDDDQGAYIDNDTWPGPHWHQYMNWLKATVEQTVGPRVPLFINTWQMKVTASAPVWAWGNWYQSDAEILGDHDIAQLAFSTALLQTQRAKPVMTSEFQAGWLQGADEVAPRASAPQNTTIALHEMLQYGVHGVINFPLADTLNPAGWEAPWTNWFYAWNAAFTLQGTETPRGQAVSGFGELLAQHGAEIAAMRPQADISIAWLPSAYDAALMPNERIGRIADLTIAALQRCRALARTCRLVDLRFGSVADLRKNEHLVVLSTGFPMPYIPLVERRLAQLRRGGIRIASSVDAAVANGAFSATNGISDAALLVDNRRRALLDVFNASAVSRNISATTLRVANRSVRIDAFSMLPFSARDFWIDDAGVHEVLAKTEFTPTPVPSMPLDRVPISPTAWTPTQYSATDAYDDRSGTLTLDNGIVRAIIVPNAGARIFLFERLVSRENFFTSIGGLRDDVQTPPSPSPRDYIAPYTHPIEAGTFNRPYRCTTAANAVTCSYDAPDLASTPVHFEKTFVLAPGSATLRVTLRSSAPAASLSAIAPAGITVGWPADASAQHEETEKPGYRLERLTYPADRDETITFSLQGPTPSASNRPQSP